MTSRRSASSSEARLSRQTQFVPGHVGGRVASAQPVRRRTPLVGRVARQWDTLVPEVGNWWKNQQGDNASGMMSGAGVTATVPIASSGASPGSSFLVMVNIWGGSVTAYTGMEFVDQPGAASMSGWIFAGTVGETDPTFTMTGPGQMWDGWGSICFVFEGVPGGAWGVDELSTGHGGTVGVTFSNTQPDAPLRFPCVFGFGSYGGGWLPPYPDYQTLNYVWGPPITQYGWADGWHTDPSPFTTLAPPEGTYYHDTIGAVGSDQTSTFIYRTSL